MNEAEIQIQVTYDKNKNKIVTLDTIQLAVLENAISVNPKAKPKQKQTSL
jgi:hypothetical protein